MAATRSARLARDLMATIAAFQARHPETTADEITAALHDLLEIHLDDAWRRRSDDAARRLLARVFPNGINL